MGQAIGDILPLAIGVAISPVPIIAVVLMLGTPRARANGPAFAVGWLAGLTIVGAIVLLLASGNASEPDGPAEWASVLKLVFGILFLSMAARIWRGRPKPRPGSADAEMDAGDRYLHRREVAWHGRSALGGQPEENLALTIAAATAIAQTEISGGEQAARRSPSS